MKNPYPHSEDNKRYQTWNYYTKKNYGHRLFKVPLDADFTCPNRDGKVSYGGCVFCGGGSSSFPTRSQDDLIRQYNERIKIFKAKWPEGRPLAYFQSYSNTYGTVEHIKELYTPFIENSEIEGLVIATRSDCLEDDILEYLAEISQKKDLWIELGLQSIHNQTLKEMNRGHDYQSVLDAIEKLKRINCKISIHLINGWPTETIEMQLQTANEVGKLPIDAIKIHMLHILENTKLAENFKKERFHLLSKQEYTQLVAQQLTLINPNLVIERITGDGLLDNLIEPRWTIKKVSVINDIDKILAENDWWQGKYYE